MPSKITLTILNGPMKGMRYRFDERMYCIIGRGENCTLTLSGEAGEGVSRHHCVLDVQPPCAAIRDLGSSNGTYLNRYPIGITEETPDRKELKTYQLKHGDIFQTGKVQFLLEVTPGIKCSVCHRELSEQDENSQKNTDSPLCAGCRSLGYKNFPLNESKKFKSEICHQCGGQYLAIQNQPDNKLCPECHLRKAKGSTPDDKISETAELPSALFQTSDYKIINQIGRGGMGAVYLAETASHEKVALKLLLPEIAVHESCREDFMREAKNLRQLKHPNIIELKDCNYNNGTLYLVLEYCSGGTLREFMNRRGAVLDLPTALDLFYQILDALDYAHNIRIRQSSSFDMEEVEALGLVHRDIKPENIFISEQDGTLSAKIADFGLSKAFDLAGVSGCTRTGDFSGTLGFIPKQQFLNFKYVKPEVDVWAAAATFFYMLTGKPPRDFTKGDINDTFTAVPPHLNTINKNVPASVAEVIHTALNDAEPLYFKTAASLKFAMQDAAKKSGF